MLVEAEAIQSAQAKLPAFPRKLAEQSQVIRQVLRDTARPLNAAQVAKGFRGVGAERVKDVLEMLVALGQAREVPGRGGYTA